MSAAGDIMTGILSQVNGALPASYDQHPRNFDLTTLPAHLLENRYSAIYEEATEDDASKVVGKLTIFRNVLVTITYRTFQIASDSKANTLLSTIYTNEEAVWNALRTYTLVSPHMQIPSLVDSVISLFNNEGESFFKNEIRMRVRYFAN